MTTADLYVKKLVCTKCGHTWLPRRDHPPKVCPVCKRESWAGEKK